MKKYILFFVVIIHQELSAQVTGDLNVLDRDVLYTQYTPNITTNDFTYNRISGKLSIPPIRLKKLSLFTTVGLDKHRFDYKVDNQFENFTSLNNFYNINLSIFANYKFSDKWSLNVLTLPYISSSLEEKLTSKDCNINEMIFLERTFYRKKGGYFQLGFGASYLTFNGNTRLMPLIQAKARFNEHWSLVIGMPSYVKWDINKKHSLKILGELNDFSANINGINNFEIMNNIDRTVFTSAATGLEYNYWITPSFGVMLKATQNLWSNYQLRGTDNKNIYKLNTSFEQPFIGIGIKYNPIRNLQNSLNPL